MLSNVEVRARRAYRFSLLSISLSSVRADAHTHGRTYSIQCESKKSLPKVFWRFFRNGWEFFVQILHVCCTFLPTLQHKFLFNWLQLWLSYAILSATTPFASYVQNVYHRPKRMLAFSDIFPKQLEIVSLNFTCILYISIYVRIPIFIQLSPTMTKLCHIKCDHPARVSADGGMHNYDSGRTWHNFVKVAGNWIIICSPA